MAIRRTPTITRHADVLTSAPKAPSLADAIPRYQTAASQRNHWTAAYRHSDRLRVKMSDD
jgi:hypothetical protein